MPIETGIITISDRAAGGEYRDLSGPALRQAVLGYGWQLRSELIVPEEVRQIQGAIREQIAKGCQLIVTTGGTGAAPRDVTPEAVLEIATRELPGFGEVMRRESLRLTPYAILSRSLAVVVADSLVLCLPGKPNAAVENLGFVVSAIPHAVEVIRNQPTHQ